MAGVLIGVDSIAVCGIGGDGIGEVSVHEHVRHGSRRPRPTGC